MKFYEDTQFLMFCQSVHDLVRIHRVLGPPGPNDILHIDKADNIARARLVSATAYVGIEDELRELLKNLISKGADTRGTAKPTENARARRIGQGN